MVKISFKTKTGLLGFSACVNVILMLLALYTKLDDIKSRIFKGFLIFIAIVAFLLQCFVFWRDDDDECKGCNYEPIEIIVAIFASINFIAIVVFWTTNTENILTKAADWLEGRSGGQWPMIKDLFKLFITTAFIIYLIIPILIGSNFRGMLCWCDIENCNTRPTCPPVVNCEDEEKKNLIITGSVLGAFAIILLCVIGYLEYKRRSLKNPSIKKFYTKPPSPV